MLCSRWQNLSGLGKNRMGFHEKEGGGRDRNLSSGRYVHPFSRSDYCSWGASSCPAMPDKKTPPRE